MYIDSVPDKERVIISSIVSKIDKLDSQPESELVLITFDELGQLLTPKEYEIFEKYRHIDPKGYGFKGRYLGTLDPPDDLIAIKNQQYIRKEKTYFIPTRFLSKRIYKAYLELNSDIEKDLDRTLLIEGAYRSPAYQMYLVFYFLQFYEFDLQQTLKRVVMPGYSEHNYPPTQAVDFVTTNGIPSDEKPYKFADTIEYQWLLENANQYGFVLSYPENNSDGIMFEPWHWRFEE